VAPTLPVTVPRPELTVLAPPLPPTVPTSAWLPAPVEVLLAHRWQAARERLDGNLLAAVEARAMITVDGDHYYERCITSAQGAPVIVISPRRF